MALNCSAEYNIVYIIQCRVKYIVYYTVQRSQIMALHGRKSSTAVNFIAFKTFVNT